MLPRSRSLTTTRPMALLTLLALYLGACAGQDGSSEMSPDKPSPSVSGSSRLRVRCTDDSLRLYHNATTCSDEREPESCKMIFTSPFTTNPAGRDPKCDNPLLEDLSKQCRKTCAICCEDPTYACLNDDTGIVNCEQNSEKCGMPEFAQMMIKFCPATCGLCLARKCRDQIEECETMKSLCTNELYATFMEHQCARTCGKCKVDEDESSEEAEEFESQEETNSRKVVPSTKNGECVDLMKNCHRNKKFCRHPSYIDMMKKNCAKTCGFCKPGSGGGSKTKSAPTRVVEKECKDNHPFCKGWAANGYCDSPDYTDEEKKDKCAKTCGYC